ncbi:biotin transporter BioY [bacterium]|nr:biotin transporter BioY [bacterium]
MTISTSNDQLRMTVYASLMAALVAAGAFIAIPVGPVPIVLQNMFVLLAALLLGRKWALACIAIYLLAGAIGLPVFSAGRGGFAHFAGPTGGYLLSYLIVVYVVGWISEKFGSGYSNRSVKRMMVDIVAMLIGSLIIYACGVPWLKFVTGMPWSKAIAVGALPFLIGDIAKVIAAAFIARLIRPIIK